MGRYRRLPFRVGVPAVEGRPDQSIQYIARVCARDGASMIDPPLFLLDSGYPAARITHLLHQRAIPADAGLSAPMDIYGTVTVWAWHHVHPTLTCSSRGFEDQPSPPIVEGTVLIARVQHLRPSRCAGDLALWYSGTRHDLLTLVMTYLARYDIEHYFRYLKTTAHASDFYPRQPDTLTTWLRLHAYAYLHLFCARTQLTHHRPPWDPPPQPR
ncbi:hypothetical protein Strop_3503 [Salinispora tropica CNB-440]|uniref:Transposase IS4-like domain-containing protein n=1 Tax=Salinispora tropica (strain ATCC BAA-916 / DSM 44818 / JCM 13857 / NBRC 105044 / CNB-440) TaxID=369723 RepID=A4XAI5_SALTO|nr:hypothetical protein Strop_3503 [Salinispora tropica CNB-440]